MQKFVGFIVVLMLLCSLTACGENEKKATQKQQQEKTTNQPSSQQEANNNKDKKHRLPTFIYHDDQYQFSLELPETWKDQFTVTKGNWYSGAEATIDFKYKNGGYSLFSILVFPFDKAAWEKDNKDSLFQYLATNQNQQTFALATPSELPPELYKNDPATVEKRAYVSNMVNVDLPKIVKTFKVR
jgi:hypothetical protein